MKYEEIQELLDRYWEGETSLEEERRIKTYFNAGPVDERLSSVAPLFKAIHEEQTVQMKARARHYSMRPRMYQYAVAAAVALLVVAAWWMQRADIPQNPVVEVTPAPKAPTEIKSETPAAAASALAEVKLRPDTPKRRKQNTVTPKPEPAIDKETAKAMAEIKAALALVSSKIEKGKREAVKNAGFLEAIEKVPRRDQG